LESISTSSIKFDNNGKSRSISNYGFEQKTFGITTPDSNTVSTVREKTASENQSMNFSKSTVISTWSLIGVAYEDVARCAIGIFVWQAVTSWKETRSMFDSVADLDLVIRKPEATGQSVKT
jgi:hypothetical protein